MALRILVVEDEDTCRYSTARTLRHAGYEVHEASDYIGALKALDEHPIDLLLADVVMPKGMNGFALARMARLRKLDLKVLFMTGFDVSTEEAFSKVLRKPISEDDLVSEISLAVAA
jgi:CheY-like chemotaxis protein